MKQTFRRQLLQQRKSQTKEQQKQRSETIARHLLDSQCFKQANTIGLYLAVNAEADPAMLQSAPHKQFYLPVLAEDKKQGLQFAPVNDSSKYRNNKFSIPEPMCSRDEHLTGEQLDLVVVPLLGFDRHGNRLGMGGGFYDRCFAFKNKQHACGRPVLVGYAYALQEIKDIEPEDWDVKLDLIVTENGIIDCHETV